MKSKFIPRVIETREAAPRELELIVDEGQIGMFHVTTKI